MPLLSLFLELHLLACAAVASSLVIKYDKSQETCRTGKVRQDMKMDVDVDDHGSKGRGPGSGDQSLKRCYFNITERILIGF